MKYLESLIIYQDYIYRYINDHDDDDYPFNIIDKLGIKELTFSDITILYGNNGSGKSTLLNLIGEKINCSRKSNLYRHEKHSYQVGKYIPMDDIKGFCAIKTVFNDYGRDRISLPHIRKLITSDDIFKEKNDTVNSNSRRMIEINEQIAIRNDILDKARSDNFKYKSLKDYDRMMQVKEAQSMSDIRYALKHTNGRSIKLDSNGETSLKYLDSAFENDGIYLLDEPENCLSPKFQIELIRIIEEVSRYCGCQFIIATHSPLILGIEGARIYNLDHRPIDVCKWSELENVQLYYQFFKNRENEFK